MISLNKKCDLIVTQSFARFPVHHLALARSGILRPPLRASQVGDHHL